MWEKHGVHDERGRRESEYECVWEHPGYELKTLACAPAHTSGRRQAQRVILLSAPNLGRVVPQEELRTHQSSAQRTSAMTRERPPIEWGRG